MLVCWVVSICSKHGGQQRLIQVVEGLIHRQVSTRIKKTERQRENFSVALPTLYQQRKAQADRIACVCGLCV